MSYFETGDINEYTVQTGGVKRRASALHGSCCSGCASGAKKCGGGALGVTEGPRILSVGPANAAALPPPLFPPPDTGMSTVTKLALLAGVGVGGFFLYRRFRGPKSNR